ncbi:F-box protein At3g57590-like [Brachypodium distachyon]|uniref:F-box protein At3g57590-like n=1 Tax=Brachypodium distachyon TaxID=15368 RepID=UPI00071D1B59|nr:F-box protein At3g57590-like [Brachypodium distachyon]|eukprot:XP_014752099.1 F-box protein At3g57590-like [Brachypodium distachyon]
MATPESSGGGEIPREMLEEILVKLPTKDVARACCVSTLWRDVVRSPSFRKTHIAAADDTAPEVLLVSEKRAPGSFTEASVSLVSSGRPMCRVNIPSGYTLANVCNGILCFASAAGLDDAPPLVCSPVTGEYLTLPSPAPPLGARSIHLLTALGFSPSTREYKLFRLSVVSARHGYPYYPSASQALFPVVPSPATSCCYLDVCTLGGGGNNDGWRTTRISSHTAEPQQPNTRRQYSWTASSTC